MSVEASITLLTSLVSVGVVVLLAAIPWAYQIHGRLTTIEVHLHNALRQSERFDDVVRRVTRMELEQEAIRKGE